MTKPGVIALACLCLLAACSRQQAQQADANAPTKPAVTGIVTEASAPTPLATPAAQSSDYALPGDFAPDTDVAVLRKRFGDAQVKIGEVPGAEGEMFRGVILFPDDSTRRAYLYFQDEKSLRGLSLVRVFETDSRWHLDNGIAMGTTLADLVKRNGRAIQYTGLDWDYGGTVSDLHGGALESPANDAVMRSWRLGARDNEQGYAANAYPVGDATFSSDDPHYPDQGRNVIVHELSVSFPGEDDL